MITDKFSQAIENYDSAYPFYDAEGAVDLDGDGNNDTLSDVEARCWSQDKTACVREKVKVLIGNPPPVRKPDATNFIDHQESWSAYTLNSAISNHIIAEYHRFKYEVSSEPEKSWHMERIAPHVYGMLLDLDILTTGPEHSTPLSGLMDNDNTGYGFIYTLRDTKYQERYGSDATGIYTGLIFLYEKGLIPQFYCTSLEQPYDDGKTCKTIDLHERMKTIFSCLLAHNEIHWMYDDQNQSQLRFKYYDLEANLNNPGYTIRPNNYTDYASGIGRLDTTGRTCHVLPQNVEYIKGASWQPNKFFYNGQMVTLLFMSTFFQEHYPGAYPASDLDKIILFTKNAVSHENAINLTNEGSVPGYFNDDYEFIQSNEFGYPVRDWDKHKEIGCDGTLVGGWQDANNNPPDCVGGTKELLGDRVIVDQGGWQYLMQMMGALDWDMENSIGGANEIRKNLPFLKENLIQSYFIDGQPWVILDPSHRYAGSFNRSLMEEKIPGRIGDCGQSGYDYVRTTGSYAHEVVNAKTGTEPFLAVSSVAYALLDSLGETEKAEDILILTDAMLNATLANTPHPADRFECWPGSFFPGARSYAQVVGIHFAYYRVALDYWQSYLNALQTSTTTTTIPVTTDSTSSTTTTIPATTDSTSSTTTETTTSTTTDSTTTTVTGDTTTVPATTDSTSTTTTIPATTDSTSSTTLPSETTTILAETTIPSETTTTPSGGGGGGSSTVAKVSRTWSSVDAGEETSWGISSGKINVYQINFTTDRDASSVRMTIQSISQRPSHVQEPSNRTYQYLEINNTIQDSGIRNATIMFKVSKHWLSTNNLSQSSITLSRYSNHWVDLPTEKIREDSSLVYYKTYTQGFSIFAIYSRGTVEVEPPTTTTTPAEETTTEVETTTIQPETLEGNTENMLLIMSVLFLILVGVLVALTVMSKKSKKDKDNPVYDEFEQLKSKWSNIPKKTKDEKEKSVVDEFEQLKRKWLNPQKDTTR
ncbi:hypothetical protein A3K63_02140 [Candidatus Micrarchaeota archaeon RBG_16_49_10]|nr:MAG: hypothetical protein A3K63_02140 [Candidatus Micrarchaeota archaeon RBG_16_49_10]